MAYGASKAAVKLLTEGLRVALKKATGIRVSVVYPGGVITGITENSPDVPEDFKETARAQGADKQVGVTASYAAEKIVTGIERGRTRIVIGPDSWFLDKLYRLLPETTASLMAWIMSRVAGEDVESIGGQAGKSSVR